MKKLIITGGTGFLGQVLINHFKDKVEKIVILTRGKVSVKDNIHYVHWNAKTLTGWETELEGAGVLINLAGKSVDCRYNEQNKNKIITSRMDSTAVLNKAVLQCINPPKHWLNASTATIYRHSLDKQMDEATGDIGFDFSMNVAKMWERTFFQTETPKTKKTALRTSIVLGKNGGAYPMLKKLTQLGFGGKQGKGRQFISWIHELDFARAVAFIIEKEIEGKINIVSPAPVRNVDFMKTLQRRVGMTIAIPISKTLLEIGAVIVRTETELVLKSRNVIPVRLQEEGFTFKYENLENALKDL